MSFEKEIRKEKETIWAAGGPEGRTPRRLTLTLRDGYETAVYCHEPEAAGKPPAPPGDGGQAIPRQCRGLPVLYLHGIQSHPGWFSGSAWALAKAGHTVFQVTRRGSGGNTAARGDAAGAIQLLNDVAEAHRFVLERTGAARAHIVAVSWGGKLAACYCAGREAADVASLVLVAPGIASQVDVSWRQKLAIGLSLLARSRRLFDIPLSDVELFTDNEPMREYLRRDPLRLQKGTVRFLFASRALDRQLARLPAGSIKVPTTLMLATRDRIIDNARTRATVERLTAGRAKVTEFPAAHTIEFEEDTNDFFKSLVSSLEE